MKIVFKPEKSTSLSSGTPLSKVCADEKRLRFWLHAAIVALVAFLLYLQTVRYDYTYLDDNNLVLDQQSLLSKPSSLYEVFSRSFFNDPTDQYYRPIVNLSFAVNTLIGGTRPFGFHLVNCLLHAFTCVFLLALLRRLRIGEINSFLAAIVFAVHPVNAASVAWIPGRNDVLLGCFAFGACIMLLQHARKPGLAAKSGHLVCFLLALFTIETAVVLPIVFIFLLWAVDGHNALVRLRWMWAGWAIVVAGYFAARYAVITPLPGYTAGQLLSAWHRGPELLSDFGKLLLPIRLQVLAAPQDTLSWPGIVVIAITATLCFMRGVRTRIAAIALALMLLPLLISLLGARYVVLETRLYLPAAGMCILLGEFLRTFQIKGMKFATVARAGVAMLAMALCLVNMHYIPNFRDRDTFSQAAIKGSPDSGIAASLRFKSFYHDDLDTQKK